MARATETTAGRVKGKERGAREGKKGLERAFRSSRTIVDPLLLFCPSRSPFPFAKREIPGCFVLVGSEKVAPEIQASRVERTRVRTPIIVRFVRGHGDGGFASGRGAVFVTLLHKTRRDSA